MADLKTLKDLAEEYGDHFTTAAVWGDLRHMAKEWVKAINAKEGFPIKQTGYSLDDLETWIKHFFNLED